MSSRRPAREQISLRMGGDGLARLKRIAVASSADDEEFTVSAAIRRAVGKALADWERDCARGHQGPIKGGACGHCGQEAK
jgi:hypothetical protein